MNTANLRLVRAANEDVVAEPEEPPQRRSGELESVFNPVVRKRAFVYDWKERLDAVRPSTHPDMDYLNYRIDHDRLFDAVKILKATPFVNTEEAGELVLQAFWRLRNARHDQNQYNRHQNRNLLDYEIDGEDMRALLELAVEFPQGTEVRALLEETWFHGTMDRNTERNAAQLRSDLKKELSLTIPESEEEAFYAAALQSLDSPEKIRYERKKPQPQPEEAAPEIHGPTMLYRQPLLGRA